MRVSIAINNYNYERYIGQAIESCLAQTHPDLEIIVVDDGSTDRSWDLIQAFGPRVRSVQTINGGQGAAYNHGFELCTGEFVLFLDSDDVLAPTAIERCVAAVRDNTSKVQFRLATISDSGAPLGGFVPYLMHSGNVEPIVRKFGHYAGPPASGNFYRRSAIARYFPMPATQWRRASDTVPFIASAFHGEIVSLDETLGYYRLHKKSNQKIGLLGNMNLSLADGLKSEDDRFGAMVRLLRENGGIQIETPELPLPWSIRNRVLSMRLFPGEHPYQTDSPLKLIRLQAQALSSWPGYRTIERFAMLLWVAVMSTAPRALVAAMAPSNNSGAVRSVLRRLSFK
ncbi:MAG: glycosyltransferase family 2 protein [Burkholderiaceae bacterium]